MELFFAKATIGLLLIGFINCQDENGDGVGDPEYARDPTAIIDGVCQTDSHRCSDGFDCLSLDDRDATNVLTGFCSATATKPVPCSDANPNIYNPQCCDCLIDLVYVIDRSGSMTHWNAARWIKVIDFLKDLTQAFDDMTQNDQCVRIAIASYQGGGTGHLALTSIYGTVLSTLSGIPTPPSGPPNNVAAGMYFGQTYFGGALDRSYAPNVMLVMSDLLGDVALSGPMLSAVQTASQDLRNQGTCIHAVAIHDQSDTDSTVTGNPFPDLTTLLAITGNAATVWHREIATALGILNTVKASLCKACNNCICPGSWIPFNDKCYKLLGTSHSWFHGFCKCDEIGGTFANNPTSVYALFGGNVWVNFYSPIYPGGFQFCSTTNTMSYCHLNRPIACMRPCKKKKLPIKEVILAARGQGAVYSVNTNGVLDVAVGSVADVEVRQEISEKIQEIKNGRKI